MQDFDHLICGKCDHIQGEPDPTVPVWGAICMSCGVQGGMRPAAKYPHHQREEWLPSMKKSKWQYDDGLLKQRKFHLCEDKDFVKFVELVTKDVAESMNAKTDEDIPEYYSLPTDSQVSKHGKIKHDNQRKESKKGIYRGHIFESLFNQAVTEIEGLLRVDKRMVLYSKKGAFLGHGEPDAWARYNGENLVPIEFKTITATSFEGDRNLDSSFDQIINYTSIAHLKHLTKNPWGILMLFSPEDSKFVGFAIGGVMVEDSLRRYGEQLKKGGGLLAQPPTCTLSGEGYIALNKLLKGREMNNKSVEEMVSKALEDKLKSDKYKKANAIKKARKAKGKK